MIYKSNHSSYFKIINLSSSRYAESVVKLLNNVCNCIEHIRYYNHVTYIPHKSNLYYKDLRLLGRDMVSPLSYHHIII